MNFSMIGKEKGNTSDRMDRFDSSYTMTRRTVISI